MFEALELGQELGKAEYEERVPALREALLEAQYRVAESDLSVVIVISGVEGSGKGEALNLLLEWMDARGIGVHALGPPTAEESERPAMFRFWRLLPPRGDTAIFMGSWYTDPIFGSALGDCDAEDFERALERIARFEQMLASENTLLVKLWLHLSKKDQKKRLEKLEADPDTAWRVSGRDWKLHRRYDEFAAAAARAIQRTDTGPAPWRVIEARDERFRNATLASDLLEALERRLARPPRPAPVPEPLPVPDEVNVIRRLDLSRSLDRAVYEEERDEHQRRLGRLARRMHADGRSAVLVFEGADAAGKGGCIRRVTHGLDARFYRVHPISAPTDEEKARPYLWRFWRNLPRCGHVAIFDRSWYGRVLVERIEGFAAPEDWRRAFQEIREFEEELVESGVLVFKFWLQISPEEQLRRFAERERTGYKRFKITPEDWRNRGKWEAYEAAAVEMIERTHTRRAPWTLVAAEDKRHARVEVLRTLCDGLERVVGSDDAPKAKRKKKRKK